MRAFHATRALAAVMEDGWVRPMRMGHVYAFSTRESAEAYAQEFGYDAIVEVEIEATLIVARWRPSYAHGAIVYKILGPVAVVP